METKFGGAVPSTSRNVLLLAIVRATIVGGCAVVPGYTKFLQSYGGDVWTVDCFFTGAMLAMMVPSGYLADKIGRARTIQLGSILLLFGGSMYLWTHSIFWFCVGEVFVGFGQACIIGSDEALLGSSLLKSEGQCRFAKVWGSIIAIEVLIAAFNFAAGSYLADIGPLWPFVYSFCSYAVLLICALFLVDDKVRLNSEQHRGELRRAVQVGLVKSGNLRTLIGWYAVITAMIRVSLWSYPQYLEESESVASLGTLLACTTIVAALSSVAASKLPHLKANSSLLPILGIVLGFSILVMALTMSPWSFVVIFAHPVVRGYNRVLLTAAVNDVARDSFPALRATISSIREMAYLATYISLAITARFFVSGWGIAWMLSLYGSVLLMFASLTLILRQRTK